MKISARINKQDKKDLEKYARKNKLNIEVAAGRAVKAWNRAQRLKEAMEG